MKAPKPKPEPVEWVFPTSAPLSDRAIELLASLCVDLAIEDLAKEAAEKKTSRRKPKASKGSC